MLMALTTIMIINDNDNDRFFNDNNNANGIDNGNDDKR